MIPLSVIRADSYIAIGVGYPLYVPVCNDPLIVNRTVSAKYKRQNAEMYLQLHE